MPICLGLDLGTTSVSAVAIDHCGEVLHVVNFPHQARNAKQADDVAEQSPELLEQAAQTCLQQLVSALPAPPDCLGLTGQMHGCLFLNSMQQPISPLFTWQDQRSLRTSPSQHISSLQKLQSRLGASVEERLGCRIQAGYALATWFDLKQTGNWPEEGVYVTEIVNFLGSRLTGLPPVIEPTFAASWGIYDLFSADYCSEVLAAADVPPSLLPRLVASGTPCGTVTTEAARRWNLPAGLPVCTGMGDSQAAFVGAVNDPQRELLLNIGTGGQIVWSQFVKRASAEIEIRPFIDQQFLHVGAELSGGNAFMWLVEQVRGWLAAFGHSPSEELIFQTLEQSRQRLFPEDSLAEKSAHDFLQCLPAFQGSRSSPGLRGSFREVGLSNFSLGHLTQAVLAGIVDQYCELYERADSPLTNLQRVVVSGNFFEHHAWTAQRIAQRWKVPVQKCVHPEQAACGAAYLAGRSLNFIPASSSEQGFWKHQNLSGK